MKNFKFKWLLLSFILSIASINTAWAKYVYVDKSNLSGYGTPYVHYWGGSGVADTKVAMTCVSGDLFKLNIPDNATTWQVCRYDNGGYHNYLGGDGMSLSDYNVCYIMGWDASYWGKFCERTYNGTEKVYFKNFQPSGWSKYWCDEGLTGWIHFFNMSTETTTDVKLTDLGGGIFEGTPAAGTYSDVILVRCSNSSSIDWPAARNNNRSLAFSVGSDAGCNMIDNLSPGSWNTNYGNWTKYGSTAALVGDFNGWTPNRGMFGDWSDNKGKVVVNLTAGETYEFRILVGTTYWGLNGASNITSSITSWWLLKSGEGNLSLTADETGEYIFQWNKSTNYFGVYYPKARLSANKVYYFDASASDKSHWNQAAFSSDFYFRYYDSESNVNSGQMCYAANAIGSKDGGDGPVYYTTAPDNNLMGSIIVDRYNPAGTEHWGSNSTQAAHGYNRSSSTQNCFYINQASEWNPTVGWKTYCPPTTSETFANNGTTVISWTTGNGTSGNPYLVKTGTDIKATASATKSVDDGDMTINYDFKVNGTSRQAGTSNTFSYTASANNTPYNVTMDAYTVYNLDGTSNSTKRTHGTTLYYKALNTYNVIHNTTFVSKTAGRNGTDAAAYHLPFSATYSAADGYNLPETITVKFGETTKEAGTDYTWNQVTGELSILADKIDGNVTITITGVEKTYDISYAAGTYGSGMLTGGTKFHFTNYTLSDNNTAFTRDNYVYDGWSTNADGSSKDYEFGGSYATNAAQIFYPHWVPAYTVEHSLTLASSVSGATGAKAAVNNVAYTATFRAAVGYNLPSDIEVTVNGVAKTKDTHYSWSVSDGLGTLTVFAASVTGNIVVTITGEPAELRFTGTGTQWNFTGSWTPACIPTIEHDVVIATNTCWIGENVQAKAKSVRIDSYNGGANIRIEAGGGLIIAEDIKAKHSADGSYEATNDQDLWIKTSTSYNGGLVCGNECPGTNAEYVFQSRIYRYGSFYINQYVGIPFTGMDPFQWYGVYVFEYNPVNDNWKTPEDQYADLKPFTAYDIISKTSGVTYTDFYTHGELNLPGTSGTQKLTCGSRTDDTFGKGGDYMFANSWIAPIDVASINTEAASKDGEGDYWGILGEVHYFNAGYVNPSEDAKKEIGNYAGQWTTLSFSASSYIEDAVIPACQAFCVTATSAGGWLKLNYGKHVYTPAVNAGQINTTPTHAPRRVNAEDVAPIKLRVKVSSGSDIADQIYIFEREDFTDGYDNSWDGSKLFGNATVPQLYTEKGDFKLSVDATPEMDGTLIGFKAGTNDYEYTFSFEYDDDEPLYLYDKETQDFTRISNEATYTFQTKDNAEHSRFALTRSNAPQIVTAFENAEYEAEIRAEKFMENNMLFIRRGDKVYSIDGTQVK